MIEGKDDIRLSLFKTPMSNMRPGSRPNSAKPSPVRISMRSITSTWRGTLFSKIDFARRRGTNSARSCLCCFKTAAPRPSRSAATISQSSRNNTRRRGSFSFPSGAPATIWRSRDTRWRSWGRSLLRAITSAPGGARKCPAPTTKISATPFSGPSAHGNPNS